LGATGTCLLSQLQDEIYNIRTAQPRIAVFNPPASFAKGKAFGDADAIHKVNTPPGLMSVTATEPELFGHWLHSTFNSRERWPSRLRYSDFIRQTYRDVKQAGILKIDEFHHSVVSIRKQGASFSLCDDSGNSIFARNVVMCLGHYLKAPFRRSPESLVLFRIIRSSISLLLRRCSSPVAVSRPLMRFAMRLAKVR